MVKAYLRYEHSGAFGVIASGCNVLYDGSGKQLFTGALESIAAWNLRQGTQVAAFAPDLPSSSSSSSSSSKAAAEVTRIALSPGGGAQLAAGYSDGTVRLWDTATQTCLVTLSGHSGAVTALRFSADGGLLGSGSADTSLVVWDVVGEAGLCRFTGHKDAITDLVLVHQGSKLISSSKDGCLKVWDVALQHCSQTLIGFKGEVWSLDVDPQEQRLVAGCVDSDLRVYVIRGPDDVTPGDAAQAGDDEDAEQLPESLIATAAAAAAAAAAANGQQQQQEGRVQRRQHDLLLPMGLVRRNGQERVALIRYNVTGQLLGVMGAGKGLEIFSVRSPEEAVRKARRRTRRKKEKAAQHKKAKAGAAAGGHEADSGDEADPAAAPAVQASDEMGSLLVITARHKAKSFAFSPLAPKGCLGQLALGLANNAVEVVDVKEGGYDVSSKLELPGHRSDVRCLALSADDTQLLSGSSAGCKLWNPTTGACLGSIDTGYVLCCAYVPGNRHAVVGTKEGVIQLIDVGSCTVVHSEQAHAGAVWSLALLPDKSGFVTGSADKTIKFWTWTVTTEPLLPAADGAEGQEPPSKKAKKNKHKDGGADNNAAAAPAPLVRRLGFKLARQLEMADDVLSVVVSPDGRLLAASLLDATIKVYYVDSLKFFLSLYGHKLPAISLDISSDSTLLISGSADKNIKVWGLDFGDCHRSLFAHQDTITCVRFVKDTHYAFSVSKDRVLKYWDMDRWEMLLELPAHQGEVWALALSQYGDMVMTGGHDRSIRRWERTSEPFFVEEERERRLESLFEADLDSQAAAAAAGQRGPLVLGPAGGAYAAANAGGAAGAGGEEGVAAAAGRRTAETVSAADSIMEALDVAAAEADRQEEYQAALAAAKAAPGQPLPKRPAPSPLMLGLSAEAYVLRALGGVRANDLEQALLLLPFADALRLLQFVAAWLAQGSQVELSCRVATLLVRLHHAQLTATPSARQSLLHLHSRMRAALQGLKDTLGFNIAALRFLQRTAKEGAGVQDGDGVAAARKALLGPDDAAGGAADVGVGA